MRGETLVVPDARQVPAECWPAELKCRSRMHYYLAERRAAEISPGIRALLVDAEGFVTETSTSNLLVYRAEEGLVSTRTKESSPGSACRRLPSSPSHWAFLSREHSLRPAGRRPHDECCRQHAQLPAAGDTF